MGNNLFGANIAGQIARALGSSLLPGTLTKKTQGTRDPNNLAAGRQGTPTTHTFRGIRQGMDALRKDTIVPDASDSVLILGDTITPSATPVVGDRITIESINFTIVSVDRDPDAAAYTCQVK
jgi:hypothetical protein